MIYLYILNSISHIISKRVPSHMSITQKNTKCKWIQHNRIFPHRPLFTRPTPVETHALKHTYKILKKKYKCTCCRACTSAFLFPVRSISCERAVCYTFIWDWRQGVVPHTYTHLSVFLILSGPCMFSSLKFGEGALESFDGSSFVWLPILLF